MIISKEWTTPASLKILETTNNGFSDYIFRSLLAQLKYVIEYITCITLETEVKVDIERDPYIHELGFGWSGTLWTVKRERKQIKHEEFDCFTITFNSEYAEVDENGTVTAILIDNNTNKPTTIEKIL